MSIFKELPNGSVMGISPEELEKIPKEKSIIEKIMSQRVTKCK